VLVWVLFLALQAMYLSFYVGALANLGEVRELVGFLPASDAVFAVIVGSAALCIPVRVFLGCAVLFRPPGFRGRFLRVWWELLMADVLWALSPFLLLHHISFGLALACVAVLVYAPFAQRSLVLMGAGSSGEKAVATAGKE
jgi:cholera toxin transcriptional activator